jgi:hypothetical protein
MFKKAFQQGRSERRGEAYPRWYVEPLSDARTKLEAFFNILLWGDHGETSRDTISHSLIAATAMEPESVF